MEQTWSNYFQQDDSQEESRAIVAIPAGTPSSREWTPSPGGESRPIRVPLVLSELAEDIRATVILTASLFVLVILTAAWVCLRK